MEVANTLNFSRAAERLRLTQPAVSHQISSLEDELGVKLFHRTSKSVRLTQEGYLYTQYAGEILRLFNTSKGRLKESRKENLRVLGIGCRNSFELSMLTRALSRLRCEDEREFIPRLRMVSHDSLENLLYDAEIQVMPTFKEGSPRKAVYREMSKCSVVCAVPPESSLAGRGAVTLEDIIRSGKIAVTRPDAEPRVVLALHNQLLADRGPKNIIFCESFEILTYIVASGFASALMVDTPGNRVPGVEYVPIDGVEKVSYGAAYMAEETSNLLRHFLEILEDMSK